MSWLVFVAFVGLAESIYDWKGSQCEELKIEETQIRGSEKFFLAFGSI